jgi:FkbM family methyltransferase
MKAAVGLAKWLRASQPFNYLATSLLRSGLAVTGARSEWVIAHVHRVGPVRAKLPGGRTLRLWSRGDDWISNQVFWRGWDGYEPETVPLFFRLAGRSRVTLDVGAHVGFYTLLAAHANPQGRVFAFEPMALAGARLRRHVALNGLTNVECVAGAAAERDGTADFYHPTAHLPSSATLSFDFMKDARDVQTLTVPVLRLDRFLRERGVEGVDLMKIDTESTEPQVLAGMGERLGRDRPAIVCEVLAGRGSERLLEDLLRPLGYRFYLLTPQGPELRERVEGHPEWLNYLFTPLPPEEVARL